MSTDNCIINPQLKIQVKRIGHQQTPIMLIDDFLVDTRPVIGHACEFAQFDQASTYYPGNRASLPRAYVIKVLQSVYLQICQLYYIPQHLKLKPQATYYSLITHQPNELELVQRMPHFDSIQPYYFAVIHYLNERPHGNTGFFRHRPSGIECVTPATKAKYVKSAQQFIQQHGEPPMEYCTQSNDHYELYSQIEYKPNRLAIYPGYLLHTGLVELDKDIDASPVTGRLTANIFVDFQ